MERPVLRRPLESDLLIDLVGEEVFLCPLAGLFEQPSCRVV